MSTTLRGDAVRLVRDLTWTHHLKWVAIEEMPDADIPGVADASATLWDAVRLQDAVGWPHEPVAEIVTLDEDQAAALAAVLLEAIQIYSDVAADSRDEAGTSQPYIRDARRALHAVMPADELG